MTSTGGNDPYNRNRGEYGPRGQAQDNYARDDREFNEMNITDPRHVIAESKIKNMCRGFKNTRGSVAPMLTDKHPYG